MIDARARNRCRGHACAVNFRPASKQTIAVLLTCFSFCYFGYLHMRFLLVLPFIGLLWIPFYNRELPSLFDFPFFYWYQLLWVPLTALLIWIVYRDGQKKGVE
jgi:hypothetical protein